MHTIQVPYISFIHCALIKPQENFKVENSHTVRSKQASD
ncbi:protein of unknown function [Nitrosotalea devaniterrae]|uniref:Uncharacterized protein n=1 Tax=Nitrosotalea devaniterrae TaxID=1078905 RepID=A0A128A4T5_9ARCH|nr:protein of unknown function [Candidatus Nitrosotalea devanaterra]